MLTMNSDKLVSLLALWLVCSSANGQYCENFCETYKLNAPLGSSVLLPCMFSSNGQSWVQWAHNFETELLDLSTDGRLKFMDHRYGRVKAFPNQASKRNYSICISELRPSDMGCYRCSQGDRCFQVELFEGKGTPSGDVWLLIYVCAGVAALTLLGFGGYFCCMKYKCFSDKGAEESADSPVRAGAAKNDLVYENDDQELESAHSPRNPAGVPQNLQHPDQSQPSQGSQSFYPDVHEMKFERVDSKRTRQRFHLEIISRIRQASVNRHFYANQCEISRQQAMAARAQKPRGQGRRKVEEESEYQNPIYNRSTEQLNQLWTTSNRM